MPYLAAPLDFGKLEAKQFRAHQLGVAPSTPATGQLYYNTGDNTLYWWDGSVWVPAKATVTVGDATAGTKGIIQLAGDLAGTAASPQIAPLAVTDAEVAVANKDGAVGTPSLRTLGVGALQATAGNDARLTNARTPTAHATTHQPGGGDAMAVDQAVGTGSLRTLGTGAQQAAAGNDSRFTDARAPSGNAGGDLTGTYPNPTIAAGVITDIDVNALNKDGLAATASMRTLGVGAQQAAPGNHTLASHPAPLVALPMNAQKITGLADGTAATDAATKGQLDAVVTGLDVKASVRFATNANVALPPGGAAFSPDGFAVANGDRVLLKAQTAGQENGIYVVSGVGTSVVLTRSSDADTSAEVTAGLFTFVSEGTVNADSGWYLQTNNPIVLGTTPLVFVQFSGAGQINAGTGLTKTGNTLDVVGTANRITANADSIDVAATYVGQASITTLGTITSGIWNGTAVPLTNGGTGQATAKAARETGLGAAGYYSSATHGAGTTISILAATHLLRASRGILVQVQEEATGVVVLPDVVVAANGDVTVTFGSSVSANAYRVTLIG